MGFVGLWVGLLAAQVCCAGLMLCVVGTTDWEAQARRAQALTSSPSSSSGVEMPDSEKGGGHASAAAAAGGARRPEKGEHQDGADYEPLISNEEAEPGAVQVL
jgi:MATE family multidrug resistance protein